MNENNNEQTLTNRPDYTKSYDIFISYRREGGSATALLLHEKLTSKGYKVFLDVQNLSTGAFNTQLFNVIDGCKDFVLICSKDCLNRCAEDGDWVRNEISRAFQKGKEPIPFILPGFTFPDNLTDDIKKIKEQQQINATLTEYFDAAFSKLISFLKSEPNAAIGDSNALTPNDTKKLLKSKYIYFTEFIRTTHDYLDPELFPNDDYYAIKVHYFFEFLTPVIVDNPDGFYSKVKFFWNKTNLYEELSADERDTIFCEDIHAINKAAKEKISQIKNLNEEIFYVDIKINNEEPNNLKTTLHNDGICFMAEGLKPGQEIKTFEINFIIPRLKNSASYPIVIEAPCKEIQIDIKYNPLAFSLKKQANIISTHGAHVSDESYKRGRIEHGYKYRFDYPDFTIPLSEREKKQDYPPMLSCEIEYIGE